MSYHRISICKKFQVQISLYKHDFEAHVFSEGHNQCIRQLINITEDNESRDNSSSDRTINNNTSNNEPSPSTRKRAHGKNDDDNTSSAKKSNSTSLGRKCFPQPIDPRLGKKAVRVDAFNFSFRCIFLADIIAKKRESRIQSINNSLQAMKNHLNSEYYVYGSFAQGTDNVLSDFNIYFDLGMSTVHHFIKSLNVN